MGVKKFSKLSWEAEKFPEVKFPGPGLKLLGGGRGDVGIPR